MGLKGFFIFSLWYAMFWCLNKSTIVMCTVKYLYYCYCYIPILLLSSFRRHISKLNSPKIPTPWDSNSGYLGGSWACNLSVRMTTLIEYFYFSGMSLWLHKSWPLCHIQPRWEHPLWENSSQTHCHICCLLRSRYATDRADFQKLLRRHRLQTLYIFF